MKQLSLLLLCFFTFIYSYSQKIPAYNTAGDEKIFTVIDSLPRNIEKLHVGIQLAGFDLAQVFAVGYGIDVKYQIGSFAQLSASSFLPYARNFDSEISRYTSNSFKDYKDVLKRYNRSEAGVTIYFLNKNNTKEEKLILKKEKSETEDAVYVLKTSIPSEMKFGARAGYYYYQQSTDGILELNNYVVSDTAFFVSSISNHLLYFGLSHTTIQHFIINNTDIGTRATSKISTLYLDLLYGFKETHQLAVGSDLSNIDTDFDISQFGFRIGASGVKRIARSEKLGILLGLEIGSRPIQYVPKANVTQGSDQIIPQQFFFSFRTGISFGVGSKKF